MKTYFIPQDLQGFASMAGVKVVMYGEEPQSIYKIIRTHYRGEDVIYLPSKSAVAAVLHMVVNFFYSNCKERGIHARFVAKYTSQTGNFFTGYSDDMLNDWNALHSDQISIEKVK